MKSTGFAARLIRCLGLAVQWAPGDIRGTQETSEEHTPSLSLLLCCISKYLLAGLYMLACPGGAERVPMIPISPWNSFMISSRVIREDLKEVTTKSDRRFQEKLYLSRNLKPQSVPSKNHKKHLPEDIKR